MVHQLIINAGIFFGGLILVRLLLWETKDKIRDLQTKVRLLEIQCNTHEMDLKRLFYCRNIESYELDVSLSDAERRGFELQMKIEINDLVERNKFLLNQSSEPKRKSRPKTAPSN